MLYERLPLLYALAAALCLLLLGSSVWAWLSAACLASAACTVRGWRRDYRSTPPPLSALGRRRSR